MNQPLTLPASTATTAKAVISPTGLEVTEALTRDEWLELAEVLGRASRSLSFVVGDWLVYGYSLFGTGGDPDRRVHPEVYRLAAERTGMDVATLQRCAYVSRHVPRALRHERLSWDHHCVLARLPEEKIGGWIEACVAELDAGRPLTLRRLRRSLNLGRLASPEELDRDGDDRGIANHIPLLNRLAVWWKRLRRDGWAEALTRDQKDALLADFQGVASILDELRK